MAPGSPPTHRLTIRALGSDPREEALALAAAHHGSPLSGPARVADVMFFEGDLSADDRERLGSFLVDPLLQTGSWDLPAPMSGPGADTAAYEVTVHAGVTDGAATALATAARTLGIDSVAATATGRRIEFSDGTDASALEVLMRRVVANPVIERWSAGTVEPTFHPGTAANDMATSVAIRERDANGLAALNDERSMALDPAELVAIQQHFVAAGREPTDVELETLAQTWSEHCSHKTFRARVTVEHGDGTTTDVAPLLRQLRDSTDAIGAKFVRSAFVGNAGIVSFHDGETLALKAETHNHPSAVEPFGGANTGVGGVIRDVMGAGHTPFAVTDILCFGPADTPLADVPAGALHPRRIIAGVIDGVADYGNKIGLPTVAGAVLYDPAFTTNPLVFCGCIGTGDDREPPAGPFPGDRVIVLGGATGRDGIRGATFSSAAMDATTGEVAGASVQIGDPITEKLLIDVLDRAGHLWTAITDCGAGGLSSAIGEMAEIVGADVELAAVPLKYPGLEPWEVWLSEAQERMVLSVRPDDVAELTGLCRRHRVELTDIGEFTGTGRLVVRSGGAAVVDLDTTFLHDGRPQREMVARAEVPHRGPAGRDVTDPAATLLALLAHPNIASKAAVVHRYDHQIGGATVVRPLLGLGDRGHADGVVLARPGDIHGIAIGIGVNPWHGLHDAESMALTAVDEAMRNVVAVGADPDLVALLDNFSWGDPRDPATLGGLVAAVAGCCAAAAAFDAPFVSGKDSLNNTYTGADGARHAVPPTLVITAVAAVPDAERCITPELDTPGNVLLLLGPTDAHFAGSHLDLLTGAHREPSAAAGAAPRPDAAAPDRYRSLHGVIRDGLVAACHDLSEGGLAVALAEMCIASGLGIAVDALPHADATTALFSESAGRLVIEVRPDHVAAATARFAEPVHRLGTVTDDGRLTITGVGVDLAIEGADLVVAFSGVRA